MMCEVVFLVIDSLAGAWGFNLMQSVLEMHDMCPR
jgi:hypothetical protein